ncbi:MAG: phytanoyl-CoA dioxygenase family protein [Leptolyngbyaceae cyanobacterium]
MLSALTKQQQTEYRQKGYITIQNFLTTAEIEQLCAECDRLKAQPDLFFQHIPEADVRRDINGNPVRDRLDPVIHLSSIIRELVHNVSLKAILYSLFKGEPTLFKDKVIFKPPGTKGYDLHQDYAYWEQTGLPAHGVLSVQVAIDSANAENGAIVLYPGLHRSGRLPAPKNALSDVCISAVEGVEPEVIATQPGDILIFHSLTPHLSGINHSSQARRTLYLSYNASRYGDFYHSYYGNRLTTSSLSM